MSTKSSENHQPGSGEKFRSDLSGKEYPATDKVEAKSLKHSILTLIQREHPGFRASHCLSASELGHFREKYIASYLSKQIGELSEVEKQVMQSIANQTSLTTKMAGKTEKLSFGQKIADKVASFGGSWTFIISFSAFIFVWITLNIYLLSNKGFDPYPFILLNLILSCIAALQAPVIMMSQNRQEEKDRERAQNDYMVNLKSELEIRMLHEKIDHIVMQHQQELLDIQKVQIDLMNDILSRVGAK
jgi:uncharacterized membrane protein